MSVKVDDAEVSVTGDFFIEPPEARKEIEAVLEKLDENVSGEKITEAVLDVDADLIGFSAEHVAEAFMEARKQ